MAITTADKLKSALALKEFYERFSESFKKQASEFKLATILASVSGDDFESRKHDLQRMIENPVSLKLHEAFNLCHQLVQEKQQEIDSLLAGIDAVDQAKEATNT